MHVELLPAPSAGRLLPEASPRRLVSLFPLLFAAAVFLALAVLFSRWNASSAWAFPKFALATLVVLYLPGRLLAEWGGCDGSEAERTAVGMCLALVLAVVFWMGLAELGWRKGFVLWPIGWTAAFAIRLMRGRRAASAGYEFRREHLLLGGLLVTVGVALATTGAYYQNGLIRGAARDELVGTLYPDLRLHLSVANELTHAWPPEAPFLAGVPLRYHVGMDVLANLYLSVGRFDPLDLYNRFLPTLLLGLLTLGAYCLGHAYLRSRLLGVCFAALLVFGNDFYAYGVWWGHSLPEGYHIPTLNSLFFHNPNLHGMTVLLAGCVCLLRFLRVPSAGSLWPVAVLFAGTMLFKVFLVAGVLGALGVVGAANWLTRRERRTVVAMLAVLAAMVPLAFLMRHGLRNGNVLVALRPNDCLGRPASFFFYTLGMRLLGVPALAYALAAGRGRGDSRAFFASFVVVATCITLVVHIAIIGTPGNDGYWTYLSTKYLFWLFALETIRAVPGRGVLRGGLLACTLGVAFVPSVWFLRAVSAGNVGGVTYTAADCRLFGWFRHAAPAGSVVLPEADSTLPLSSLTKCRTVTDSGVDTFSKTFLPEKEFAAREQDCVTFWERWDAGEFRADIAARYRVTFLLLRPAGRKADPLGESGLRPSHDDGTYRVYDLRRLTPADTRER